MVFAGKAVTEAGAPVRGVRVRVWKMVEGKPKGGARSATTDRQGGFRLTGFEPATYRLIATRGGLRAVRLNDLRTAEDRLVLTMRRR